ncbi:MAG: Tm-1-like ATP-binding domain-containing protein [Syntrophorhabdaceae bacterium]|nr:Tm-1-like ATP-binding domain-containing protein [Syntrophorhabdaceae bacterium]
MKKTLLIVATLDTKGREAGYLRDRVRELGLVPLVMDVGTLGTASIDHDIPAGEVARTTGMDPSKIGTAILSRSEAVEAMQKGGSLIARQLYKQGKIDGILGLGGGTGTAIATAIMRSLPFGMPKLVVSTVASRDVRQYVGTRDIVMFHSVADLLGSNHFVRFLLEQAARAVCGMVEAGAGLERTAPMIAVTAYGLNSRCAMHAEPLLERKGYEMIGFHANGVGGMAMEEMVGEGLVEAVLDLTCHEIADEMFGGYCRGIGRDRFRVAGERGVPVLLAPGGLDNAVFSPFYPMPDTLKGRRRHDHDDRFCIRMESGEMVAFAAIIAERLKESRGPSCVLIPSGGWSEADKPGGELYDPEVDRVFTMELRKLLGEEFPIEEMEVHISDPAFAQRAVEIIDEMVRTKRSRFGS